MTREIGSLHDLLDAADDAIQALRPVVWWRGQSQTGWALRAGVFRFDRGPNFERSAALQFMHKAGARRGASTLPSDPARWLFLMQHYRLPTRLLDWTESALIATFFAVSKDFDRPGELIALNPYRLNESQTGKALVVSFLDSGASSMIEAAFSKRERIDRIVAISTPESDVRMAAQMSAFTLHGSGVAIDELSQQDEFVRRYTIPAAKKKTIQKDLWMHGIRISNVFPDLEHLAEEIAKVEFDPGT